MCPKSALPPHMQGDVDDVWAGTDNSSWLMRMKKRLQYIFAAGPRVPSGFWKWRDIPICVWAKRGKGFFRIENTDGTYTNKTSDKSAYNQIWYNVHEFNDKHRVGELLYLSRIQPWTRWHISLQWPLYFNCHFIYRAKDVVKYPKYQSEFGWKKMITFGIGYKRDGDKVYWLSANAGGNFE